VAEDTRTTRPAGGFTLAEIIVVVVIIGIAAAVIVPLVVDTGDMQATAAARMIAADLQYAQNQAITRQQDITVTFDAADNSYVVSNASGTLIHPITKKAYSVDFDTADGFGNLNVVSASFGGTGSVTFDELGSPGSAGTITIQAGASVYTVSVTGATGRVTVASGG